MLILTLRTDKPEAELGLYDNTDRLAYISWLAHRELAETIQQRIDAMLKDQHKTLHDLSGIIAYEGPGSFTGLRIGLSVANALAYGLGIPIVASGTDEWVSRGNKRLQAGQTDGLALPQYGALPNITRQRK